MKPTQVQKKVLERMAYGYRLVFTKWAGPDPWIRLALGRFSTTENVRYDTYAAMQRNGWLRISKSMTEDYPLKITYTLSKKGQEAAHV